MARRIYIISKSMKVEDALEDAQMANCPEIVHGIPPILEGIIKEISLPMVFEEPKVSPPQPPRDLAAEIDELKKSISALKGNK